MNRCPYGRRLCHWGSSRIPNSAERWRSLGSCPNCSVEFGHPVAHLRSPRRPRQSGSAFGRFRGGPQWRCTHKHRPLWQAGAGPSPVLTESRGAMPPGTPDSGDLLDSESLPGGSVADRRAAALPERGSLVPDAEDVVVLDNAALVLNAPDALSLQTSLPSRGLPAAAGTAR